jgi:hypothetical protein
MQENTVRLQPLQGPLWPLLCRAGFSLLRPQRDFGASTRQFRHQLSAPAVAAISAYQQHFAFAPDAVPLCFYYPLLQRAQLASMLQCRGLRVAGLIHIDNQLEALQAQTPQQLCSGGPVQIHTALRTETDDKGLYLRVEQQFWQQGQQVLRASSGYLLKKIPRSAATVAITADVAATLPVEQHHSVLAQIQTQPDAARRYARLSGDFNPIHLWHWSARLFGQRQPILHGMASTALLCQSLPQPPQSLIVRFRKPVYPGSLLQLCQISDGLYQLYDGQRLCLEADLRYWPDGHAVETN